MSSWWLWCTASRPHIKWCHPGLFRKQWYTIIRDGICYRVCVIRRKVFNYFDCILNLIIANFSVLLLYMSDTICLSTESHLAHLALVRSSSTTCVGAQMVLQCSEEFEINTTGFTDSVWWMKVVNTDAIIHGIFIKPNRLFNIISITDQVLFSENQRNNNDKIQSTLIISNSKGLSKILRDIRTLTYQICRIEEKLIWLTTFNKCMYVQFDSWS